MKKTLLVAAIAALASTGVMADVGLGVGVKISTLGIGLDLTRAVTDSINVRGNMNYAAYDYNTSENSIDYRAKLKLQTIGVLADWHPLNNGFRVSGGLYLNGNKATLNAKPAAGSTITMNGTTYSMDADGVNSANGEVKFDSIAPYIGLGWGNAISKDSNWGVVADLGLMYQNSPKVSLDVQCGANISGTATCDQIQADAAAARAQLSSNIDSYKWYPVLSVGLSYRF